MFYAVTLFAALVAAAPIACGANNVKSLNSPDTSSNANPGPNGASNVNGAAGSNAVAVISSSTSNFLPAITTVTAPADLFSTTSTTSLLITTSSVVAPVAPSPPAASPTTVAADNNVPPSQSNTDINAGSNSNPQGTSISITPHDSFSSSVGVLGCKINPNRVAYWPSSVSCDNLCVKVSHADRSVYLLKIDQSGGAHDISYDAWNYLSTGSSAANQPSMGGGIDAVYADVDMSFCSDLLLEPDHKLAFSAANSMNFVASCLAQPSSWVARNYALYNIANSACTLGVDEKCEYLPAISNQPQCKNSVLGSQASLTSLPVMNMQYGTGKLVQAV